MRYSIPLLIVTFLIVASGGFFAPEIPAASAFSITEHTVELTANPGDVIEREIFLYDDALEGALVYPVVTNFTQNPEREGSALLVTDPDELKPDRAWVEFDDTQIIVPKDGGLVPFTYRIVLPPDAEPGTHLLSLVFQTRPPNVNRPGNTVVVGTNVVTNIFLKVTGATKDDIDIDFRVGLFTNTDVQTPLADRVGSFEERTWFSKPPVDFLVTVLNAGNTHQKPDGNIKIINDLFGTTFDTILVNAENRIVLPDSQRTFEVDRFGSGFMFGKFRAKLTVLYGDPLRDVTKEVSFWIIPVVEIVVALLILLVVILLIILWIVLHRRKKKEDRETLKHEIERDIREGRG